jgi:hypothetical protein
VHRRFAPALFWSRHSLRLGGQHGEEGKGEEDGCQEVREERRRQEEEGQEVSEVFDALGRQHDQTEVAYADNVEERPAQRRRKRQCRLKSTTEGVGETRSRFTESGCQDRHTSWP